MTDRPTLRRVLDLPGIADLEYKALMKPRYADPESRWEFPEIDEVSKAAFGLTCEEAEEVARPEGWDRIEMAPIAAQVIAFEEEGWDVTDGKRRPLRMLAQFSPQLWLALRGVAGRLPFHAEKEADPKRSSLAAEAAAFKRDRR